MYLSVQEARGGSSLGGTKLNGLGFEWSDIISGVTNLVKNPQVAQLATQLISKPKATSAPAPSVPVLKPTAIAPGPGGAALPTANAPAATSIWSNKWTWVALGGGVLLLGVGTALLLRRRE